MKKLVVMTALTLLAVPALAQASQEFVPSTKTFPQYVTEGYEVKFQLMDGGWIVMQKTNHVAFCQIEGVQAFSSKSIPLEKVKTRVCFETAQ